MAPSDTGVASGLVNTSQQIGGALGLAVLAAVASAATGDPALPESLTSGYTTALLAGGGLYLAALVVAAFAVTPPRTPGTVPGPVGSEGSIRIPRS
ncbi:hypothetical protein [Sphaerisporangium perillae]|uniref:hypothetical protein n=1 Tax=Sphaerisporangium perillae TaxID=2935860 RepID=UPI00200D0F2E|nr:hypothetical protein [Sphaerisporangium perillae]